MSTLVHIISVIVIVLASFGFYFNYDLYRNTSYTMSSKYITNNYNYACSLFGTRPFYVVVKSENLIDNCTIAGDLITGFVGGVPVLTGLSIMGLSDVQYMQYTSVYPIEDQNGLLVENCVHVVDRDFTVYKYIAVLISVIVLLTCLLIYGLFNRVWLCFSMCRSVRSYDELN